MHLKGERARTAKPSLKTSGCRLRQQDARRKHCGRKSAAKSETAQTGSSEAGSAVANDSDEAAPAHHAEVLELMEELKHKTNGVAMLARDCPPENGHSAREDRVPDQPSDSGRRSSSSSSKVTSCHAPFVCAPEDFRLEPGMLSRVSPSQNNPLDIFRCSGCTRDECQVSSAVHSNQMSHRALEASLVPRDEASVSCTPCIHVIHLLLGGRDAHFILVSKVYDMHVCVGYLELIDSG